MNLGGVVSPRNSVKNQQQASSSPAPAAVPQPSPNQASASQNTSTNQHQTNLIGVATTQITAQQPHQQQHQANIQQIPSSTAQTMKEQPQQPMVSAASIYCYSLTEIDFYFVSSYSSEYQAAT